MAIFKLSDLVWTITPAKQSWPIGQKVKFNSALPQRYPNAFNYEAIYEILSVSPAPNDTFSYTIFEKPEKTYFIHESFLEKVDGPSKCICDLHTVLMVSGCKCKGL